MKQFKIVLNRMFDSIYKESRGMTLLEFQTLGKQIPIPLIISLIFYMHAIMLTNNIHNTNNKRATRKKSYLLSRYTNIYYSRNDNLLKRYSCRI